MDMTANRIMDYSLEKKVQVVLGLLDEAIDEYNNCQFISEEELFNELEGIS